MNKRIKTVADIRDFLDGKIAAKDNLLAKMESEQNAGQLPEFMRYNAIELAVAVFHADEARKYLNHLGYEAKPDGTAYSDEDKFADISGEVSAFVLRRVESQFSDVGRSSSLSANMAKDAVKDFFIQFYQRLNEGY